MVHNYLTSSEFRSQYLLNQFKVLRHGYLSSQNSQTAMVTYPVKILRQQYLLNQLKTLRQPWLLNQLKTQQINDLLKAQVNFFPHSTWGSPTRTKHMFTRTLFISFKLWLLHVLYSPIPLVFHALSNFWVSFAQHSINKRSFSQMDQLWQRWEASHSTLA